MSEKDKSKESTVDPRITRTGVGVVTLNAQIIEGKIRQVSINHNMPEWTHAGMVLAEGMKIVLNQIENAEKGQSQRIFVPVGPIGRLKA